MKKLGKVLLSVILILSVALSVCAVSSVPKPVIKATESVVRVLVKYVNGYSTGSGFVIKSDKNETLIATNYHVVEGKPYSISVWLSDDETIEATLLAYTNQKDMCILRLTNSVPLKPLTLSKKDAKQGEAVYAVGYPGAADFLSDKEAHSSTDATITDGIISAVREATVSSSGTPTKILQINAAINAGNSGGPLFNEKGEVVGINTYGIDDSQGIFGAIAVDELEFFMKDNSISIPNSSTFVLCIIFAAIVLIVCLGGVIAWKRRKGVHIIKKTSKSASLREYMELHPDGLGMNKAVAMLLPVALQLRDIHNDGKAHLQVSSNSIVVSSTGAVLTKATDIEAGRYTSGYAAPEIYTGKAAGNLSDIYSFCAVLLYVASGVQPLNSLSRKEGEVIEQALENFDEDFEELLSKGMNLAPERRFASIQDLIIKLSKYNIGVFEDDFDTNKAQPETVVKERRKVKITPKQTAIIAGVIAVLMIVAYFGCYWGAVQLVKDGDFTGAEQLLFLPSVTKAHDPDLVAYVDAGRLIEERKYDEARTAFGGLPGYLKADEMANEASYLKALQLADKNDFVMALSIMNGLEAVNYKDAGTQKLEIEYRWASLLIEEGEYVNAYNKLYSMKAKKDVGDLISQLTELMYLEGQVLYKAAEYGAARNLFSCISNYENSEKYLTLIKGCTGSSLYAKETVAELKKIFDFEDAAKVLLKQDEHAEEFLRGTWKGDGYSFKMKSDGSISYDLPWFDYGDYYKIEDGTLLLYPKNKGNSTRSLFYIEAITPDCIEVFCYKNNRSYTLTRR